MTDIHVGDIGTRIIVTVYDNGAVLDVSTATSKSIVFTKPTGTKVTKTATNVTDGTNGQIYYAADASFFDAAGRWQYQAVIGKDGGTYHSNIGTFDVESNL